VPYPLILLHVSGKWKATKGQLPRSLEERQEFVKWIQQESRNFDTELNFQEAVQNAYLAYTEPRRIDMDHLSKMEQMLETGKNNNHACQELQAMLGALRIFLQQHSRPPLHGTIPDMTASTDLYVQLQQVYRDQAAADMQAMRQLLLQQPIQVSDDNLLSFCQNVTLHIDVYDTGKLTTNPATGAAAATSSVMEDLVDAASDPYEVPEQTPIVWFLAFQACQAFYQDHGRYPGCFTDSENEHGACEQDATKLMGYFRPVCQAFPSLAETDLIQQALLQTSQDPEQMCMSRRIAQECTRWANAELHTIGSIVGGVASQEAVKLITGQFIPLNNTYVYNGICSVGAVYKF
jgi:amyloid beta precursor protein binding protein 1